MHEREPYQLDRKRFPQDDRVPVGMKAIPLQYVDIQPNYEFKHFLRPVDHHTIDSDELATSFFVTVPIHRADIVVLTHKYNARVQPIRLIECWYGTEQQYLSTALGGKGGGPAGSLYAHFEQQIKKFDSSYFVSFQTAYDAQRDGEMTNALLAHDAHVNGLLGFGVLKQPGFRQWYLSQWKNTKELPYLADTLDQMAQNSSDPAISLRSHGHLSRIDTNDWFKQDSPQLRNANAIDGLEIIDRMLQKQTLFSRSVLQILDTSYDRIHDIISKLQVNDHITHEEFKIIIETYFAVQYVDLQHIVAFQQNKQNSLKIRNRIGISQDTDTTLSMLDFDHCYATNQDKYATPINVDLLYLLNAKDNASLLSADLEYAQTHLKGLYEHTAFNSVFYKELMDWIEKITKAHQ